MDFFERLVGRMTDNSQMAQPLVAPRFGQEHLPDPSPQMSRDEDEGLSNPMHFRREGFDPLDHTEQPKRQRRATPPELMTDSKTNVPQPTKTEAPPKEDTPDPPSPKKAATESAAPMPPLVITNEEKDAGATNRGTPFRKSALEGVSSSGGVQREEPQNQLPELANRAGQRGVDAVVGRPASSLPSESRLGGELSTRTKNLDFPPLVPGYAAEKSQETQIPEVGHLASAEIDVQGTRLEKNLRTDETNASKYARSHEISGARSKPEGVRPIRRQPQTTRPRPVHPRMPAGEDKPAVRVSIGRIEVRAITPSSPPPVQSQIRKQNNRMSLDDYLKARNGAADE